jgi:hypothetical protein
LSFKAETDLLRATGAPFHQAKKFLQLLAYTKIAGKGKALAKRNKRLPAGIDR